MLGTSRSWLKRGLIALLAVILLLALLVAVVHTPFVQARVSTWLQTSVLPRIGLAAQFEDLDYNLFRFSVTLDNTTLAATAHPTRPFLTAKRISAQLPWSVLSGPIAIHSLDIDGGRLSILRTADGGWNLPRGRERSGPAPRVLIDRLQVSDLQFMLADEAPKLTLDAQGVAIDMRDGPEQLSGTFQIQSGLTFTLGASTTTAKDVTAEVRFDGSTVHFNPLRFTATEGPMECSGSVGPVLENVALDASCSGEIDSPKAAAWLTTDLPVRGPLATQVRITGPLGGLSYAITAKSRQFAWSRLENLTLDASLTVSSTAADISTATITLPRGGTLISRGRLPFDREDRKTLDVEWRDVPLPDLIRLATDSPPLQLTASATGTASLRWTSDFWATLGGEAQNALTAGAPADGVLPIDGTLTVQSDKGQWQVTGTHRVVGASVNGSAAGRFASTVSDTPVTGTLAAQAESISNTLSLLERGGIATPLWLREELSGQAVLDSSLAGTLGQPRLEGPLRVTDLRVQHEPREGEVEIPGTGSGRLALDLETLTLTSIEAAIEANRATGNFSLRFDNGQLDGRFAVDAPHSRAFPLPSAVEPWMPEGPLTGDILLSGTTNSPRLDMTVDGISLALAGQTVERAHAQAHLTDGILVVDEATAEQQAGILSAKLRYDLNTDRLSTTLSARAFHLVPVLVPGSATNEPLPIDAVLDLDFTGEGPPAAPTGMGQLAFTQLTYSGVRIGESKVDITIDGSKAELRGTAAQFSTTFDGTIELESPRTYSFKLDAPGIELATVATAFGDVLPSDVMVSGTSAARATVTGSLDSDEPPIIDAEVLRVDGRLGESVVQLEQPARVRIVGEEVSADNLRLRVNSAAVVIDGVASARPTDRPFRATLDGTLADLLPLLKIFPKARALDGSGNVDLDVSLDRSSGTPVLTARLDITADSLSWGELPPASALQATLRYDNNTLAIEALNARWQEATIVGSGSIPGGLLADYLPSYLRSAAATAQGPANLSGRVDHVTSAALSAFAPENAEAIQGNVSGTFAFEADTLAIERVKANVTLENASVTLAGVSLTQERPTRVSIAGRQLTVEDWAWRGERNELSVTGGATFGEEGAMLGLRVVGNADLRVLSAFVRGTETGGFANFDMQIQGPIDEPEMHGQVSVADGSFRMRNPQVTLDTVEMYVTLTGTRIDLLKAEGFVNGGWLRGYGTFATKAFRIESGELDLGAWEVAFEYPQGLQQSVNAELTLSMFEGTPVLRGRISIVDGGYRQHIGLMQLLGRDSASTEIALDDEPSFFDRMALEITVITLNDIIIDNNYGRLEVAMNLQIIGTVARPGVIGRATILEGGQVFLGGRVYQIESGAIDFTNPSRIEPTLQIRTRTRVSTYDVSLMVSGTPGAIKTDLSSDPPLSRNDLLSLLATGRTVAEGGGLTTEVAGDQVLGLLSGELFGFVTRTFGLSGVRIERGSAVDADIDLVSGNTEPATRLTINQRIGQQFELVYSRNLRTSGDYTWIAAYRPKRDVQVRTVSRDDTSRSLEFLHEITFGGSGAARSNAVRRPRPEKVTKVTIGGEPGFPEDRIRREIHVREGRNFDFYRWQRDRDRLKRLYRDEGYLETRIDTRRQGGRGSDAPGQGIQLEYRITRGPRTSLVIEGTQLPESVVRDLENTWAEAVFDGFLLDDLTSHVRGYLAERGFLQAKVNVRVETAPDDTTKRVVIQIDQGPHTDIMDVRFTGNTEIDSNTLLHAITSQGRLLDAWLNASLVAREVEGVYRARGYLAASAIVHPPRFDGHQSTVVVDVKEGPRFVVGETVVEGATARPEEEVRQEFAVEQGRVYAATQIDQGATAVETSYRAKGFTSARVSTNLVVDRTNGVVNVTLTIVEGPRQILKDITITGNEQTKETAIERNLKLMPGTPVDMNDFYQARRRLYEMGVFRNVDITTQPLETSEPSSGADQPVRAVVMVEEAPLYRFRYGFQLDNSPEPANERRSTTPGALADLQRRNLFGRAITTGVAARYQRDDLVGRAFITSPRAFGLPMITSLYLTRANENIRNDQVVSFVTRTTGLTFEQRRQFSPGVEITHAYRFERNHTIDRRSSEFDIGINIARSDSTAILDMRDSLLNPTRGFFHSSNFEVALNGLGSDARFVKYLLQQFSFAHWRGLVFGTGVRVGLSRPLEGDEVLIPSERFFAGGGTTVRGFREDALGPRDILGFAAGGQGLVVLNGELRFPLYRWFGGVLFLDAGNVFDNVTNIDLSELRQGYGFGLRLNSPIALIRVDYGIPVGRREGEPRSRWYFAIGHAF